MGNDIDTASGGSNISSSSSGGVSSTSSGGSQNSTPCTDEAPDDRQSCSTWAEWGECETESGWLEGFCDLSCGRCTPGSSGDGDSGGDGDTGTSTDATTGEVTGDGDAGTGEGNPWGGVSGGEQGWASRYWDCCKQSCAWSGNAGGNPVHTCDASGDNVVSEDSQSTCSGGSSTTCNSFAPWTYSPEVAFGFAATHAGAGAQCGRCYKLQFTGSSHNGGADPGSAALNGKVMIVMATNIGGDVNADGQLDLLIPGGGTGAFYGCEAAWGVKKGDSALGAEYGGLRSGCSGDLSAIKSCVTNKCQSLFGSHGLDEMYEGCMWYADWFEAADNPSFKSEVIDCPAELNSVAR